MFADYRKLWTATFLSITCLTLPGPALGQDAPEPQDAKPALRIICVSALEEDQKVVIASRDESGTWKEHGEIKLRSSYVTDWLPVASGSMHLAVRVDDELESICRFTYPAAARRALLVLLPDVKAKSYHADLVNPAKLNFAKGSTLLVNYSPKVGTVMLGARRASVKPGERAVMKPIPDPNGMFRMLVAYTNEAGELVNCYDRYIGRNSEARNLLLLFPDPVLGLRAYSLPEFGPFE